MYVQPVTTFEQWRDAARPLLAGSVPPAEVEWGVTMLESIPPSPSPPPSPLAAPRLKIPASVLTLLQTLALYRAAGRWELMYRLVWRILNGLPHLLDDAADPDVRNASLMERAVKRDVHKMHAYVRFRETHDDSGATFFFAWFEPQHEILRRGAEFFVKRFPNQNWTIATPDGAAVWRASDLSFVGPPDPALRPQGDDFEDLWRTYYRSICNVARINPAAMQREMPQRYWRHLPEATEISALIRDGAANLRSRPQVSPAIDRPMPIAVQRALPAAPSGAENPQTCRRCELWRHATQPVVGEGEKGAQIMLVGEQPGDEEDLRGHAFVGPAGKVLDQAIAAAGLDRRLLFITNAVKHFKWEPRGKRRLHVKPGTAEIKACNIWLQQEIDGVQPRVIVALGATALRALCGKSLPIAEARREDLRYSNGAQILATYHPSAILRAEGARADELRACLEADLRAAADIVAS